jgi:hypothetical protein
MARRDRTHTPDSWPGWSDAHPIDESDALPDTDRSTWQICWIRRHAEWHPAIITAWRRTVDGGWAAHTAWGVGRERLRVDQAQRPHNEAGRTAELLSLGSRGPPPWPRRTPRGRRAGARRRLGPERGHLRAAESPRRPKTRAFRVGHAVGAAHLRPQAMKARYSPRDQRGRGQGPSGSAGSRPPGQ